MNTHDEWLSKNAFCRRLGTFISQLFSKKAGLMESRTDVEVKLKYLKKC